MRRRSFIRTGSIATATIGLAGCTGDSDQGKTLQINVPRPEHHFTAQGIQQLGETLSEETDGRLDTEYINVGSEEEGIDAVSSGSVDGALFSMTGLAQTFDQGYSFLESAFVTQSWDHYESLVEEYVLGTGGFNDVLVDEADMQVLDSIPAGWRGVMANQPVTEPSDVEGLTMRLPQYESWIRPWEELGVEAEPIPTDEIYQALETGVVEASEGPIPQIDAYSLQEVQSHFSEVNYLYFTWNWTFNEGTLESLSDDDRELLSETLEEVTEWQIEEQQRQEAQLKEELADEIEFVPTDEIDRQAFFDQTEPVIQDLFENMWNPTYDEVSNHA